MFNVDSFVEMCHDLFMITTVQEQCIIAHLLIISTLRIAGGGDKLFDLETATPSVYLVA